MGGREGGREGGEGRGGEGRGGEGRDSVLHHKSAACKISCVVCPEHQVHSLIHVNLQSWHSRLKLWRITHSLSLTH